MKTIISIATTGNRPHQLANTLESLRGQADEIRVYDNSRLIDYTDNAKFYPLQFITELCYFITCDDDLIYPPTFVIDTKMHIDAYQSIVSWHGRILKPDQLLYYNSNDEGIQHWKPVDKPMRLDVAGTGCTGFRTDYFNPVEIYRSEHKRMSDLVFSLEAWKQGKQIISPPKRLDYIIEQPVESSIFASESKTDQQWQIWHMKQILLYKNSLLTTTP